MTNAPVDDLGRPHDPTVSVITDATGKVSDKIHVVSVPDGVAITPDGKRVYVVDTADDAVSVITAATGKVSDTIKVGNKYPSVAVRCVVAGHEAGSREGDSNS